MSDSNQISKLDSNVISESQLKRAVTRSCKEAS